MFRGQRKTKLARGKLRKHEDKELFNSSKLGQSNELSSFKRRKEKLKQEIPPA